MKLSTPSGYVEVTAIDEKNSGDLDLIGPFAECSEAYWSSDRECTIVNNCAESVKYEIKICSVGCVTHKYVVRKGGEKTFKIPNGSFGISEPIVTGKKD